MTSLKDLFSTGLREAVRQFIFRHGEVKKGALVGVDRFGNKYYERYDRVFGRERWVDFKQPFASTYDGSHIPPEWHGWMHKMNDAPPSRVEYNFPHYGIEHTPNLSGTPKAFQSYSTTKPKYETWKPRVAVRQQQSP